MTGCTWDLGETWADAGRGTRTELRPLPGTVAQVGVDPSIGTEQGFDWSTARVGCLVEKDATATAGMASTKSGRCRPDPIDELLVTCRVAADAERPATARLLGRRSRVVVPPFAWSNPGLQLPSPGVASGCLGDPITTTYVRFCRFGLPG